MVPKLLTVVADCYGNSKKLQDLRKHNFILFVTPEELPNPSPGLTLVYGYQLAKTMFDNVSIGDYYIDENTRWTFNEFESKDDVYIDEWINESLDIFFTYTTILGKYDEADLHTQLDATDLVFLYNGNHELYLYDAGKHECITWSHEEIDYRLGIGPTAFAAQIANYLFNDQRAVYAWDPFNLKTIEYKYDNVLIFIRDLAMAATNTWLTKKMIKDMVLPHRTLNTPEFMKYVSHMPDIYSVMEQKDYLRRFMAGELEQLYSNAEIYFNRDKLLREIQSRNKSGIDAKTLTKIYTELGTGTTVQIPYRSRDKVTGRMFPRQGVFNPITESDTGLLHCITTRHTEGRGGAICVFDFTAFEPTIISELLELPIDTDIHQRSADILQTSRESAKKLNNMILYGASEKALLSELKVQKIGPEQTDKYLQTMEPIIKVVDALDKQLKASFKKYGFIRNAFGRIVYPRDQNGCFNNFIQATASDLFNTASLHVFDLLREYKSKLFLHKFDALYVDVHPAETGLIEEIVDIMANKTGVLFTVKVYAGKDLGNLRVLQ